MEETIKKSEIAFGVTNDGDVILNLKDDKGVIRAKGLLGIFEGQMKIINESEKEVFLSYALADVMMSSVVHDALRRRVDKEAEEDSDDVDKQK